MFIELDKDYTIGSEALKTLIEQVYYLDNSIVKCDYKDSGIFLKFQAGSKVNEKILKEDIIQYLKASDG